MAHKIIIAGLGMVVATTPSFAFQGDSQLDKAPAAAAGALYCLHIEPITGTRIEMLMCKTRDEWSALELDVDKEWADNGFKVIDPKHPLS